MLAPDARAVLLEQLRPPIGQRLDAAVATTFTLDLTAALVPPLAFAAFELTSTGDPIAVMEAVRSSADRLDIFCQAGQISVPAQASDLLAFLEPAVHEVRRPKPGHLFHPKLWLLRYTGVGEPTFRLLSLTRNLTHDHSWDVTLRLDGRSSARRQAANAPLADLVRALPGLATRSLPTDRQERLLGLAADLRRVVWELPDDVAELRFHVLGLRRSRPELDFRGYRHLVVAPFVNDAGLELVAPPGSPDVTLVSRVEDLDRLRRTTLDRLRSLRVVTALAGVNESGDGVDGTEQNILAGLHAKLFVVERNRRAHLFIGSANATDAAFRGNVEVLVELVGGASRLGTQTFLGPEAPFATLLEEYAASGDALPDPEDEARRLLDDLLRKLATVQFTVSVETGDSSLHRLALTTEDPLPTPSSVRVTSELLTRPGEAQPLVPSVPCNVVFTGVRTPDVSPFIVLRARDANGLTRGTVVRAALVGDPPGRLDEILARQVDTPEKFLRFLTLLLGLSSGTPGSPWVPGRDGQGSGGSVESWGGPGVFELLLRALADSPSTLDDVDRLVRRLRTTESGQRLLPPGFEGLWSIVDAARRRLLAEAMEA